MLAELPIVFRAPVSASKLGQISSCPGSVHAQLKCPPIGEDDDALEGTLLHWHDASPGTEHKLTAAQRDTLGRNRKLRETFIAAERKRLGIPDDAECIHLAEHAFILLDENCEPVISHGSRVPGHSDHVYYFPAYHVAIIVDSKFGHKAVTKAWANRQLGFYALCVDQDFQCKRISVAITQPWMPSPDDFHCAEYLPEDMPALRETIIGIIRSSEPADAPRHGSPEACVYCSAKAGGCPEAVKSIVTLAQLKMADMTPEQLENISPVVELAEQFIDAYWDRLKLIAKQFPDLLSKHQLKPGAKVRKVEDLMAAFLKLAEAGLIVGSKNKIWALENPTLYKACQNDPDVVLGAMEVFMSSCKLSFGELTENVAGHMSAREAEEKIESALGDLIVRTNKEGSLVKKEPKRLNI